MPYIKQDSRESIDKVLVLMGTLNVGELNYAITKLVHDYCNSPYRTKNYQTYNDVVGVLECAKQELYRSVIGIYEEQKRKANGDI